MSALQNIGFRAADDFIGAGTGYDKNRAIGQAAGVDRKGMAALDGAGKEFQPLTGRQTVIIERECIVMFSLNLDVCNLQNHVCLQGQTAGIVAIEKNVVAARSAVHAVTSREFASEKE